HFFTAQARDGTRGGERRQTRLCGLQPGTPGGEELPYLVRLVHDIQAKPGPAQERGTSVTGHRSPWHRCPRSPSLNTSPVKGDVMSTQSGTILVVGATGSIGTLVTAEAASRGYRVRALARPGADSSAFGDGVEVVHGDLTDSATLGDAVDGIDAVIFTHGAHQGSLAEKVDYGGVRNVLTALHG